MAQRRNAICISLVTHVVDPSVRAVFERLRREAPADHDVRIVLNSEADPAPLLAQFPEDQLVAISRSEFIKLPYPGKCFETGWAMSGNIDLVFQEFARRYPDYDSYWFVEYDVHWEGHWSVFFEHFRGSDAGLLATSVHQIDEAPEKLHRKQPVLKVPPQMIWQRDKTLKAFLPICRLSRAALAAQDAAYRQGLAGHYELTLATVVAHAGLAIEDFGGRGRFVKPENVNRFYFARPTTYSHSPGTFVFRPGQHPLRRPNTLWHPVKPDAIPLWHPMRVDGAPWKRALEQAKPLLWRLVIWWWFATRWRPLRTPATGGTAESSLGVTVAR